MPSVSSLEADTRINSNMAPQDPPSRLARNLGTTAATLIGMGSMIGAGVFVVFVSPPGQPVAGF